MHTLIKTYPDVLDAEFCRKLIAKFCTDPRVASDPQPDYSLRQFLSISNCADWMAMISPLVQTTNELAEDYFSLPGSADEMVVPDWIDDGFVMAKYAVGDTLALHADGQTVDEPNNGLRIATVLYFLNSCEGGELHFPIQKVKIAPKQGMAAIFPPDHWFPHEVLATLSERFIVQTWLTDPTMQVIARNLDEFD